MRVVIQRPLTDNVALNHVMVGRELNNLIALNYLGIQRLCFEVETGPNAAVQVLHVVKPLQLFCSSPISVPEIL